METIGSLTGLEQIHLSNRDQHGWRHDLLIDHKFMREHLGKLPILKNAFLCDSYSFDGLNSSEVESYYQPGHRNEACRTNGNRLIENAYLLKCFCTWRQQEIWIGSVFDSFLPMRQGPYKRCYPKLTMPTLERGSYWTSPRKMCRGRTD